MDILNSINSPADLQGLSLEQLYFLADDIRDFLIEKVSKNGGHLASNLGAVELSIALHRVYNTELDRIVFDVGHQSYVHKMLTGRRDDFDTLRKFGGLSGFPKPEESEHDAFIAGHASNSVAVALGMARARAVVGEDYNVVAVIGDGALSGGLAYEGLSSVGTSGEPMVVILNDNEMSISPNVGGMANLLSRLRVRSGYLNFKRQYRRFMRRFPQLYSFNHSIKEGVKNTFLPRNIFSEMGLYYLGPVDGHDIAQLESALITAKEMGKPTLLHVTTQKGKGYILAEEDPASYHGVSPFDPEEGVTAGGESYSSVFGEELCKIAEEDETVVAITAAMTSGVGLSEFAKTYPDRFFDVGIAEGAAVCMAGGLAKAGATPVFAVYSSFLQRGLDMMIHDVALQKLHVVFAVDRAGIVGADGETHHGVFDVAYLSAVPYMTILCPSSYAELRHMLDMAVNRFETPVAIRYPRGGEGVFKGFETEASVTTIGDGADVAIVAYGDTVNQAICAADRLADFDIHARIIKLNIIMPFDAKSVAEKCGDCRAVVVCEEVCDCACVGKQVTGILSIPTLCMNLGEGILPHGSTDELRKMARIDSENIAIMAMKMLGENIDGEN